MTRLSQVSEQEREVAMAQVPLDELLRAAAGASRARVPLRLTDIGSRSLEDLVRIAALGGEYVSFAPAAEPRPAPPAPRRRWFARRPRG